MPLDLGAESRRRGHARTPGVPRPRPGPAPALDGLSQSARAGSGRCDWLREGHVAEACLIGARETPKQEGWFVAGLGLSSGSIPECRPCCPPTPTPRVLRALPGPG